MCAPRPRSPYPGILDRLRHILDAPAPPAADDWFALVCEGEERLFRDQVRILAERLGPAGSLVIGLLETVSRPRQLYQAGPDRREEDAARLQEEDAAHLERRLLPELNRPGEWDRVREQLADLAHQIGERVARREEVVVYVTLDQMAATVSRSKKTLERLKRRPVNPLPDPDIAGGGGRPDEWNWDRIRPWLEAEFGRQLPSRHPSARYGH